MSKTYNYTEARKNFAEILERVTEAREVITITHRNSKDAVILSKEEYSSIIETIHLFKSPVNAERLRKAISNAYAKKNKPMTIEELKKAVGLEK